MITVTTTRMAIPTAIPRNTTMAMMTITTTVLPLLPP